MAAPTAEAEDIDKLFKQQRWEEIWAHEIQPGELFDRSKPLPELVKQVSRDCLPTHGRALVPGCGRGYDVELLSEAGYKANGIEISATGATAARKYLADVSTRGEYEIIAGDFFTAVIGEFDLVYDYTFFCALPLERRAAWGERMGELVRKGGELITAMYPMGKGIEQGGPPFGVSEKAYRDVLGDAFVPVDGPREVDEESTHRGRGGGRTWWCRWKRV